MAVVKATIQSERATSHGWEFNAGVESGAGVSTHIVSLDWADHDHWSGGAVPPSRVAEAVLRVAAAHLPGGGTPSRFNASTLRRMLPNLDALVRAEIDRDG